MSFDSSGHDSEEFPFQDRLALLQRGENPLRAGDPWHYTEKVTEHGLEGVSPPLWVVAFTDNPPGRDPGPGEPARAFTIEDDQVKPRNGDYEPANDEYFVVKPISEDRAVLVVVASHSGYSNGLAFDGETVVENLDDAERGQQIQLPPGPGGAGALGL